MDTTFFHPLHGTPGDTADALRRQSLLAASGRLAVVASASGLDVYDALAVADLGASLGAGTAKLRFLASFPMVDIEDRVAVTAVAFLRGGLLAVGGTAGRGAVVHVYRLALSAVAPACRPAALPASGDDGCATDVLPQLVFRALLRGVPAVRLLAHYNHHRHRHRHHSHCRRHEMHHRLRHAHRAWSMWN